MARHDWNQTVRPHHPGRLDDDLHRHARALRSGSAGEDAPLVVAQVHGRQAARSLVWSPTAAATRMASCCFRLMFASGDQDIAGPDLLGHPAYAIDTAMRIVADLHLEPGVAFNPVSGKLGRQGVGIGPRDHLEEPAPVPMLSTRQDVAGHPRRFPENIPASHVWCQSGAGAPPSQHAARV